MTNLLAKRRVGKLLTLFRPAPKVEWLVAD